MKTGYSLLLRDYVAAEEINYNDCRDFQVACPCCKDPVFKSGDVQTGKRQFLAHYAASKSDVPDCELRVACLDPQAIASSRAESRGQHLALFQEVFIGEAVRMVARENGRGEAGETEIRNKLLRMFSRPAYRSLSFETRKMAKTFNETNDYLDALWEHIRDDLESKKASPFWVSRQEMFARDFIGYILSPNSMRVFTTALSCSLLVTQSRQKLNEESDSFIPKGLSDILCDSSDSVISKAMANISYSLMYMVTTKSVFNMLFEFPYIEVLERASKPKVDAKPSLKVRSNAPAP